MPLRRLARKTACRAAYGKPVVRAEFAYVARRFSCLTRHRIKPDQGVAASCAGAVPNSALWLVLLTVNLIAGLVTNS